MSPLYCLLIVNKLLFKTRDLGVILHVLFKLFLFKCLNCFFFNVFDLKLFMGQKSICKIRYVQRGGSTEIDTQRPRNLTLWWKEPEVRVLKSRWRGHMRSACMFAKSVTSVWIVSAISEYWTRTNVNYKKQTFFCSRKTSDLLLLGAEDTNTWSNLGNKST